MALVFATCTLALLPFRPPLSGKSVQPDYGAIANHLVETLPVDSWINAEMPVRVLTEQAEGGLRKMRAAYRSAPDYAAISGAMAAAALRDMVNAELPDVAADVAGRAEAGLRQMRAAYSSAPDYAKISGAVAAAGVALAYTQSINAAGMTAGHGFSVDPEAVRFAAGPSVWKSAKAASPEYGAIAATVAALGHMEQAMRDEETTMPA